MKGGFCSTCLRAGTDHSQALASLSSRIHSLHYTKCHQVSDLVALLSCSGLSRVAWGKMGRTSVMIALLFSGLLTAAHQLFEVVPTYSWRSDEHGALIDIRQQEHERRREVVRRAHPIARNIKSAILQVDPGEVRNGATATVSWSGVEHAQSHDWIGLYCPGTADDHEYVEYWFVSVAPTYRLGRGSLNTTLWNMRTTCEFRYYGNNTYTEASSRGDLVPGLNNCDWVGLCKKKK